MPSAAEPPRGGRAGGALLAALVAAGCGGGGATAPEPSGSGYFVGRADGDGLGAAVDFRGADRTAAAVRRALRVRGGGAVAIASVVNDGSAAAPVPVFTAELAGGVATALVPARRALAGRRDAPARAALRRLPPLRRAIPGEGSAITYLVLRGRAAGEVRTIVMRPAAGTAVELVPRAR